MLGIDVHWECPPFTLPLGNLRAALVGGVDDGTRPRRPGRRAEIWVRWRWREGSGTPQREKVRKTAMHMARHICDHGQNITAIFHLLQPASPIPYPRLLATMSLVPTATNMTINEMIPDRTNPAHDPRFWCLPPVRDSPNGKPGRFPMYLVSQGRKVGVWHNW